MSIRVERQFELPTDFMSLRENEWIPRRSHDETEAERRAQNVPGALVLEQQHRGALLASRFILLLVNQPNRDDLIFGSNIVAAAAFGSARLSLQDGKPVRRRNFVLPLVADPETDTRLNSKAISRHAIEYLKKTAEESEVVLEKLQKRGRMSMAAVHRFGRLAGNTALRVAILQNPNVGRTGSPIDVQDAVLAMCTQSLLLGRQIGEQMGTNPTLAMFGDPKPNPYNSYIEEHTPDGAARALEAARLSIETKVKL